MNHPYRGESCPDASPWESGSARACLVCRARAALARPRMRRVLAVVLVTGVMGANVASTLVACSSARESAKALASMNTTLLAVVRRLPPLEGTARAASPTPPAPPQPSAETVPWKGIVRLSNREFLVDAQTANDILEEQSGLAAQAWVVPEEQNGRVVGIRLFGVTPHSLLGLLGVENGDRIESINGYEMSHPDNALSAYGSFRRKGDVLVILNRHGRTLSLHYRVL
jgi:membrane-associated protease RseP (regulator of RpoE activity)